MVLSTERVDLIEAGFDMAIRIGPLADSRLIARPLTLYQMIFCASPEYLNREGVPRVIEDLSRHRCLGHAYLKTPQTWQVDGKDCTWPEASHFRSNDGRVLRAAALEGAGIILQPEILLERDVKEGRLIRILDGYLPPPREVNIVYLPDANPRRKLMSLVNWLLTESTATRF